MLIGLKTFTFQISFKRLRISKENIYESYSLESKLLFISMCSVRILNSFEDILSFFENPKKDAYKSGARQSTWPHRQLVITEIRPISPFVQGKRFFFEF